MKGCAGFWVGMSAGLLAGAAMGMIYLFCHGIVENAFGLAIWSSTLLGGVVEMAANAVLTMAIAKALERFVRPAA